ncbi:RHS repeat protein [Photorhabdus tasmaniensis]
MKNIDPTLYQCTPTVSVYDNRGLTIRDIGFHRTVAGGNTDTRISRHQYDVHGRLIQSIDPRLYDVNSAKPNFTWKYDLTGNALRTESVDAGHTVTLNDIEGRQVLLVTATGVTQIRQYEAATLPGRLLSVSEQAPEEETPRITEHLIWAGNTQEEKDHNLAGQCVRHYDTAGLNQLESLSLTENILSKFRKLLLDDGQEANWEGDDEIVWWAKLNETYTTQSTFDATGALLTQIDAKGNRQRLTYDVAGQLKGSWLTVKNQSEQIIVKSLTYSAAGQKLREEHGSGIITEYSYEPETQRLIGIKTHRSSDTKVLQDLRYQYDPVGNVIGIRNDAEATRFWRNQKVVPENTYTYDSLYQLISTTGREMANIGQQSNQLPSPIPLPTDNSTYTNYTRTYDYDRGGNLAQIRHSSPATQNNYTTDIIVSNLSNHAVLNSLTTDPTQVDTLFDAGGHQKKLLPGQDLCWNARGELQQVTPVSREHASDREWYRYGNDGMRQLKVNEQQTGNSTQQQRVTYLPGLELRTTQNGATTSEDLHVITVGAAGHAQVRVLHWETTPPAGISNNQFRYSYDNLIGSSQLELDSEGQIISQEEYYPFGGTALWAARNQTEVSYKTLHYSGKERDATGLYYYGYRYYQPWVGRWLSADPAGTVDGLNLYRMVRNNPSTLIDISGLNSTTHKIFGFNVEIDNPEEESGPTRIRVKDKFLNFGPVDQLLAEKKPGLNVPEELFDRSPSENKESILTFKKDLPISCISSTEYTLDILYNKSETKPFPYLKEAAGEADLGVKMSVEFGNKSIGNASDVDLKEDILPLKGSTDKKDLPTLKQGLMIAEKIESTGESYPFHFGAAIAVVYDENKKVAASILTDLSEPKREEGEHLQNTRKVDAMFIRKVSKFRGHDYPKDKYSIGLVTASKRPVITKKRSNLGDDIPSSSRNKKLHLR